MTKNKRITFLLGAGISIPAGLPATEKITKSILGRTKKKYGDKENEDYRQIIYFLEVLENYLRYYYSNSWSPSFRIINYEELYFLANQIYESKNEWTANPTVQSFANNINEDFVIELLRQGLKIKKPDITEIAEKAVYYIHEVTARLLSKEPRNLEKFRFITDACCDANFDNVDIITLNHDQVLEKLLNKNNIAFTDGFGELFGDVRSWCRESFYKSHRVKLLHIHGAVNLYKFHSNSGVMCPGLWYGNDKQFYKINNNEELYCLRDNNGKDWNVYGKPKMLIGTDNKISKYANDIYFTLWSQMFACLDKSNILIVSGYSFGDLGVNNMIIEWCNSCSDRKIVIVHGDPNNLRAGAVNEFGKRWDDWVSPNNKKLLIYKEWIENAKWDQLKKLLCLPAAPGSR